MTAALTTLILQKENVMTKALVLIGMLALLSPLAAAAQEYPPPVHAVAEILQLTPTQLEDFVQFLGVREQTLRPLAEEAQRHEEAIGKLAQSEDADPAAIGRLIIELRKIRQQMVQASGQARQQFELVLQPDQLEKLHGLREAAKVEPAVMVFRATGLID
jgi:LTXXQ motif family protein